MKRNSIALLITLLFIILITASIGINLKHFGNTSKYIANEKFLYQTSIILDDLLTFLNTSKELNDINSSEALDIFLSDKSFIPIEMYGLKVSVQIKSARSKFNINSLIREPEKVDMLKRYMDMHMANIEFVDVLLDGMSGEKTNMPYNSYLFEKNPELFKNYITSKEHFQRIEDFFIKNYNDKSIKKIDFQNLFYFTNTTAYKIDLNFATPQLWEMMLGCDAQKAKKLSQGHYTDYVDLGLNDEELNIIKHLFKTSLFEPYLYIVINVIKDKNSAVIEFEYDIHKKKGINFVYKT